MATRKSRRLMMLVDSPHNRFRSLFQGPNRSLLNVNIWEKLAVAPVSVAHGIIGLHGGVARSVAGVVVERRRRQV
jgi:hypothetical protein